MKIEYLEPNADIGARIKLNGETYLRLVDVARDFDLKFQVNGIGAIIAKMFREANPDVFFYLETNTQRPRGYYMAEPLLDKFVHFATKNASTALGKMQEPKKLRASQVKPKRAISKKIMKMLPTEVMRLSYTSINGSPIEYFVEDGSVWVRLRSLAAVLRPDANYLDTFATFARQRGLTLRAIRSPNTKVKPSYYGPLTSWSSYLNILTVPADDPNAAAVYDRLKRLALPQHDQYKVAKAEVDALPELVELRAMNRTLVATVDRLISTLMPNGKVVQDSVVQNLQMSLDID